MCKAHCQLASLGSGSVRNLFDAFLVLVCWLSAAAAKAAEAPAPDSKRLLVVASILPLADFARQVGGDRVRVETLVPPGASPHTNEITPAQMVYVSRTRLLVLNGVGLEFWADKVISAAHNPKLLVVRTAAGIKILAGEGGKGNPHVWLSPINAIHQVNAVRDALSRADPADADSFRNNARRYDVKLHDLDHWIRRQVATFSQRKFIAFHPAWSYFARDYGLREVAVIERTPGQEPYPGDVVRIIRTARAIHARAIFAEPEFSAIAARTIAEESGAKVLFLYDLGRPPAYRYLDMMRYDLQQMAKALR